MERESEEHEALPDALAERLRRSDRAVSQLTPDVDRTVIEAARTHFAPRGSDRKKARVRATWAGGAVAASFVIAALLLQPSMVMRLSDRELPADVDRSGRVDIVDVLMLAKSRRDDGRPSQAEIDRLAERIVSLSAAGDRS